VGFDPPEKKSAKRANSQYLDAGVLSLVVGDRVLSFLGKKGKWSAEVLEP
jgi:hypothetical protein